MTQKTTETTEKPVISTSSYPKPTSRFGAFVIDSILCGLICLPLAIPVAFLGDASVFYNGLIGGVFLLIQTIYFSYFNSQGQTLGHKVLGLNIRKEDGSNLTFGEALIRHVVFLIINSIPVVNLLNLFALIDSKKQNLYDKLANVVYKPANEQAVIGYGLTGCTIGCGCVSLIISLIFGSAIIAALVGGEDFQNSIDELNTELQQVEKDLNNQREETKDNQMRNNDKNNLNDNTIEDLQKDLDTTMEDLEDRSLEDLEPVSKAEFMMSCLADTTEVSSSIANRYCECLYNADLKNTSVAVCTSIISNSTR